jgi:hypothetical protein
LAGDCRRAFPGGGRRGRCTTRARSSRTWPRRSRNTAADHVEAVRLSLAQLPRHLRRRVLVRADSAGGTHEFLEWLTARSRRLHYSAGMTITGDMQAATGKVPADAWTPAYDGVDIDEIVAVVRVGQIRSVWAAPSASR